MKIALYTRTTNLRTLKNSNVGDRKSSVQWEAYRTESITVK